MLRKKNLFKVTKKPLGAFSTYKHKMTVIEEDFSDDNKT